MHLDSHLKYSALLLLSISCLNPANATDKWSLHDQLKLPNWLTLTVDHRTRYEAYTQAFKAGTDTGGDQGLAFRTLVFMGAKYQNFSIGAEFIDSRMTLEGSNSTYSTALSNQTDLLQAYADWQDNDFFDSGLNFNARVGRQTIDYGSRRLISRSRYRNTINNFTGLDISISESKKWQWRNFIMFPVSRLPNDSASIKSAVTEFDQENIERLFTGTFFRANTLPLGTKGELYLYYLNEKDTDHTATKNRNLITPGFRWLKAAKTSQFDFEYEQIFQTGSSHASKASSDTTELKHFAHFSHIEIGYSFDAPWKPRLIFQYDYASGDKDPTDNKNNRFETLYGARRFDFAPTGIWGPFKRSNISTPGLRLKLKPAKTVSAFIAHRAYWLAEAKDSWTGAKITDTTGQSGNYLGQQIETRIRWNVVPQHIRIEGGWAHLFKGSYAKNAPNTPSDKSDSDYFYLQTSFHL